MIQRTPNDYAFIRAQEAIQDLFHDDSVSKEVTLENLETLRDEIEVMISELGDKING